VNFDASLISYFVHAGLVVKGVMLLLLSASIFSWAYILQRSFYIGEVDKSTGKFEKAFWSGQDLAQLYEADRHGKSTSIDGMEAIFQAGFKEFLRFRKQAGVSLAQLMENTRRAMQVAQMREYDKLETNLSFLAIVGSTSPYVGLFGTVWGIMQAFQSLANVQQATISMVAPGIAEALIATALGLFAAIPAVIAYNRFVTKIGTLNSRFDAFEEEFTNLLIRQTHQQPSKEQIEYV
jgi:biopolymer transport protein TolQ